jgi:hypothetical protein
VGAVALLLEKKLLIVHRVPLRLLRLLLPLDLLQLVGQLLEKNESLALTKRLNRLQMNKFKRA